MRKPSIKVYKKLMDEEKIYKTQMLKSRQFLNKFDGEFWKLVTEWIDTRLRNIYKRRSNVDELAKMDERELKILLAQEEVLKDVKSMPTDIKNQLEKFEEAHSRIALKLKGKQELLKSYKIEAN